jgi:hypothetical protein
MLPMEGKIGKISFIIGAALVIIGAFLFEGSLRYIVGFIGVIFAGIGALLEKEGM